MVDGLSELVDETYQSRHRAWDGALKQVLNWLERERHVLLNGHDEMRLGLDHRVKDQARALAKLRGKVEDDPSLEVRDQRDVERHLGDIVGVKVLCKTPRDQDLICEAMEQLGKGQSISLQGPLKDYVAEPKDSGYRARHAALTVDVFKSEPVQVEVQVKTRFQDAWSELTHEDLYKPGGAMNRTEFHSSVARTMAALLAEVDRLADDLARDLEAKTGGQEGITETPGMPTSTVDDDPGQGDQTDVRVRTTGPRYALGVDRDGRQGLMTAKSIRDALGLERYIRVDEHVRVGDQWRVTVVENDDGRFYLPTEKVE